MANVLALHLEEVEEMVALGDAAFFWGLGAGVAFAGGIIGGVLLFT